MRMVDVLWEGQTVEMFAEDVQTRGEEITTKAAFYRFAARSQPSPRAPACKISAA